MDNRVEYCMSFSAASSSSNTQNVQGSDVAASNQRATDGDCMIAGIGRAAVRHSDGGYKPLSTAQTTSSSSVQAALTSLRTGG